MPNSYLHRVYEDWITINYVKFIYKPRILKKTSHSLRISFEGLNPNIALYLRMFNTNKHQKNIAAEVWYESRRFDIQDSLWCGDMLEKRDNLGRYYCAECLDVTYYTSREALWHAHIFDDLLAWVNNITPNQCLVEWGESPGGIYGVTICSTDEVSECHNPGERVIPLVVSSHEKRPRQQI